MSSGIALFGEAQKGDFSRLITLHSVENLHDKFGMPPCSSKGIWFCIQLLMNDEMIYFYRVQEEGFSLKSYHKGLQLLEKQRVQYPLKALCMPGLGDRYTIDKAMAFCKRTAIIFLCNQDDFYDYITDL